ncbi:Poly (ADP-ribose) polymerase [Balamuthia mandrillaris]
MEGGGKREELVDPSLGVDLTNLNEEELAKLQEEMYLYWQKKRKQEEEDLRIAMELQKAAEEESKSSSSSSTTTTTPAPTKPPTTATTTTTTTTQPQSSSNVNSGEKEKATLSDSDFARMLQEEEEREAEKARLAAKEGSSSSTSTTSSTSTNTSSSSIGVKRSAVDDEDADRKLAEELWRKEQEEEQERKKKKEWEDMVNLIQAQAKAEADELLAKELREKEELLRQLEEARALAVHSSVEEVGHVAVNLSGVEYPDYWENQVSDFQVFDVKRNSEEWNRVASHFTNTLTGMSATVTRIERNQNRTQWTFYYLRRQQVALKNKHNPNEKMVFHGSRANAYEIILKDGFDHRVAHMGGAIGAGVYFATHSSTSTGYVSGTTSKGLKKMLYCRVTLGSVGQGQSGLRRPPAKDSKGQVLHDSVGSVSNGNGMYVVFDNHQAYPEYTIFYK